MKIKMLLIILFATCCSHLHAQGQYLPESRGLGLGMSGGIGFTKDIFSDASSISVTDGSTFEVGIGYSRTSYSEEYNGAIDGNSYTAMIPYVTLFATSREKDIVSPSLTISYWKYLRDNFTGHQIAFTFSIFHVFEFNDKVALSPEIGVNKLVVFAGSGSQPPLSVVFALTGIFRRHSDAMFLISPSLSVDKDDLFFGLGAGVQFSSSK